MAGVADIVANLRINTQDFVSGLSNAASRVEAFGYNLRRSLSSSSLLTTSRTYQDILTVSDQFGISIDAARRRLGITREEYRQLVAQHRRLNAEAERSRFAFKDVARIIGGIIVARIFYSGLMAIRQATDAVWEFSKAIEYADITYSNLFGDAALSKEFVNVLQDFAAETVFSFEEAEEAARRLLSYGIQYKNVMYVMEGVMAGATVTGNSQNIERISRALGQIYTKGRLMGEEMRQLAEAGVPAYEILIEKLGLTQKQLQNLGRESIPASKAINALVDGINERFGSVVNAAALTTTGLINKTKDNALILANGLLEPLLNKIKNFIGNFANSLNELRLAFNKFGTGGVFEAIVPKHLQTTYRTFAANMINFGLSIKNAWKSAGDALANIGHITVNFLNKFLPALTIANHVLATFVSYVFGATVPVNVLQIALTAAAGALILFLGNLLRVGIVKVFIVAINALTKSLLWFAMVLQSHPILLFITLMAIGLAGLASTNTKLGQSLRNLAKDFSALNGADPDKVLLPESKERAADLGKFNNELDDTSDAMDELADSTGKAAKAGKQLLSFDEVFKINEPDEGSGSGVSDALEDISKGMEGLGAGLTVPDTTDFANKFVASISESLMNAIRRVVSGGTSGSITGALIGFAIGGLVTKTFKGALAGAKYGAGIGALLVGGFALFWGDAYKEMEESLRRIAVGGAVGTLLGGLVGLVIGAFATHKPGGALLAAKYGAAIGALLGTGIGGFWALASAKMSNAIESIAIGGSIGTLVGGLIGMVIGAFASAPGSRIKGALTGALYGSGIGSLLGAGLTAFWAGAVANMSEVIENSLLGGAAGSWVGGLVGLVIGAFIGAPGRRLKSAIQMAGVGAGIGALVGAGLGTFWSGVIANMSSAVESIGAGAAIGTLVGGLVGLIIGAFIGAPGTRLKSALTGASNGAIIGGVLSAGIAGFWAGATTDMEGAIEKLAVGGAVGALVGGLIGMLIGAFSTHSLTGAMAGVKIGASIGGVAGGLIGGFWDDMTETMRSLIINLGKGATAGALIGATLGLVIGAFATRTFGGAIAGAKWGASIGAVTGLVGGWVDTYWSDITNTITRAIASLGAGATAGGLIGGVLGFIIGAISTRSIKSAFVASKWGASIGAIVGAASGFLGEFFPQIETKISEFISKMGADSSYGALMGGLLGFLLGAVSTRTIQGALAGSKVGATIGAVTGVANAAVSTFFSESENQFAKSISGLFGSIGAAAYGSFIGGALGMIIGAIIGVFAGGVGALPGAKLGASIGAAAGGLVGIIIDWWNKQNLGAEIGKAWSNLWDTSKWEAGWAKISAWFSNLFNSIKNWFIDIGKSIANWWNGLWDGKEAKVNVSNSGSGGSVKVGHATGGIFNREHIARFAEGNKAEAVIPLENASAMQPFVDAISSGITQSLLPAFASAGGSGSGSNLPPMYVGALIADERGLRELNKRMQLIQLQEDARKGLV